MPSTELPVREHEYQNHSLDSTYWDRVEHRDGDIIIATALKAGTTWMQTIIANLVFQGADPPGPVWEVSPWIGFRANDVGEKLAVLDAQTHRRFMKTHLPLDGLTYRPELKYVYVGRDGRDVFMSLWNHTNIFTEPMVDAMNNYPGRVGEPFPTGIDDIHDFFHGWITRGWFPWEQEGYPYWSVLRHAQTWFDYRHLPNILLVHFNDLLADLDGEMRRISDYLEIPVNDDVWLSLVEDATFDSMKKNAETVVPGGGAPFAGGAQAFLFKGTNGRWVDTLTADELELYDAKVAEVLTPECAQWLEHGRMALE